MALYRYVKEDHQPTPVPPPAGTTLSRSRLQAKRATKPKTKQSHLKLISSFLVVAGMGFFFSVAYPVVSYQIFTTARFQPKLLSPLSDAADLVAPTVLGQTSDFTLLSSWLPRASEQTNLPSKITDYTVTIPKLKIADAAVKIGGEHLKDSLIHYGGSALPGEFGNAVIFGHSVLPQFFNPKNYLTIFSTLPAIEKGDEVFVNFDGIKYHYVIYEIIEVEAEDVSILEQRYDNSYLTLVTCVPPGTYWKRLAVRARLEKI